MLGRSPILLHHIAWEIDDYQTWYNFALVSKKCSQAARYFTKPKKREFSQPQVVNGIKFQVLPNGWVHGPTTYFGITSYYIDGYQSQTAIWKYKHIGFNDIPTRIKITEHLYITESNKRVTLEKRTENLINKNRLICLKCPNCGWIHIIHQWAPSTSASIFIMTQRCGDKSYQRLVIQNIIDPIKGRKWNHFSRYCFKHPTGFRFQDIPVYFQK